MLAPRKAVGVYEKPQRPLYLRLAPWAVGLAALGASGFFAVRLFS